MKKLLLFLMLIIMTFTIYRMPCEAKRTYTDTPVTVKVNGEYIKTDSGAYLIDGFTFVPIRFVSDALCAESVEWEAAEKKVTVKRKNTTISLLCGSKTGYLNGKAVTLDAKPIILSDRVYVPVRFISESFGARVTWDSGTYTVDIIDSKVTVPEEVIYLPDHTEEDIYWLSRIINAESGGEPMEGKIAVGSTVLNRVESKDYPNDIYGVIFDRKYGVQYEPTANGTIYNTPYGDSVVAAKRALRGEKPVANSMFFLNPAIATNFWIVNNKTFYRSIGNHDFYV